MIWAALREIGEHVPFTLKELASKAQQEYGTVHKYIEGLKTFDYVGCIRARAPHEKHESAEYQLLMNTGPQPPAPKGSAITDPNLDPAAIDGLTKCWLAMRQAQSFDSAQIQTVTELKQRTVERYLGLFLNAGYIAIVQQRRSGYIGQGRQYRMVRNTGPLAPVFRRDGSVFDVNLGEALTPGPSPKGGRGE